jgi:hypothetical protein
MPTLSPNTDGYQVSTSPAKLIKRALRILGVIDPGENLEAEELRDGLEGLNHMLDSWNTEKLVVPSLVLTSTSVSTRLVTVGPGGDVDIYRPPKLEEGQVFISTGDIDYRLAKMSAEDYGQISSLTISGRPSKFYYDASSPVANLYFDETPDVAYTLKTFTWKLLAQIADNAINGTMFLEPGYARAICFNLALDLADEWDGKVTPNLISTANVSKASIKSLNVESIDPVGDSALSPITQGWVDRGAFNSGGLL